MSGILFSPPQSTWGQPPSAVRQSEALPSVAPGKKLVELGSTGTAGGGCRHVACPGFK